MAKINKNEKIKSVDNPLPSKIKSKSADEVSEFAENIINTVRELLLILDKDLRVIKASRSFYDFFKVTSDETIGKLIYDLGNHQWNIPKLRELLETILPEKTTFDNYEVEHDFSTIGKRIMLLNARQIERAFGKKKIILLSFEDITDRKKSEDVLKKASKQAEEKLQENEEKYRSFFENSMDAILLTSPDDGKIFSANLAACRLFGYSKEEIIKLNRNDIVDLSDPQLPSLLSERALNGKARGELTFIRKDRTLFPAETSSAIFKSQDGLLRTSMIIRDITERKQAEKELQWKTAFFEAQVNSSIDGILVIDNYGKKILQNQRCIDLWKIPQNIVEQNDDAVQVQYVMNRTKYPEQFVEKVTHLYSHPDEISYDEIEFKDGMFLDRYSAPVLGQDGTNYGRIWTFRDITERKQAEELLLKSKQQFDSLVSKIPVGIYILHTVPEGTFVLDYVSPKMAEMFDVSVESLLADSQIVIQSIHPDDRDEFVNLNQEGIRLLRPFDWKGRVLTTKGVKWLHLVSSPELQENREVLWHGLVVDITERKLAEEALMKSENEFHTLAESMPQIVWITRADGWNIYFNQNWVDYTGLTLEESYGHGWNKPFHPDDQKIAWDTWQNATKNNTIYSIESRLRRADGTYNWFLVRGVPLMDNKGTILKWFGTCTDINELKLAEDELRESEERFRVASESLTDIIYDWDIKEKIDWYGDIDGLMGYSPGGFPRTIEAWAVSVHPEDKDRVMAALESHLKGVAPYIIEYRIARRDGELRWWSVRGIALRNDRGEPYKMIGSITDITERKLSIDALNSSEAKFRSYVNDSPQGIFVVNAKGQYIDANDAALNQIGCSKEYLLQKTIADILPKEELEKGLNHFNKLVKEGKSVGEFSFLKTNGEKIDVILDTVKISDDQFLGFSTDITERKQAEEKIREKDIQFRKLSSQVPDLIFQFTRRPDGTYFVPIASEGIKNIFGCSPADVLEDFTPIGRVIFPDDLTRVISDIEYSAKHLSLFTCEFRVQIPGKSIQWIYSRSIPEKLADGSITWYGFSTDITERKLSEVALYEREQLFRGLFNASPMAITLMDPHNRTILWPIIDCNEATCLMNGFTREELIGHTIDVLNARQGSREESDDYFKKLKKEGIIHVDVVHRHKDGHLFPIEASTTVVTLGGHEMVLGIDHDITERKRAEAELQASNDAKRIFAERLAILSETTTELSKADSLDELCRRAVELCRERLHFDRPSILFVTEDSTAIQGTFGVDVDGRITDERGERYPAGPDYDFWPVIQGQVPLLRLTDAPLALKGQNVGQGTHIIAGLFDGNTVIGYISIDNLISKRPFDDSDCEIIHLYASAVGHLCSLKRTEETLRNERSLFRTLIDNIPDSIYSKDTQGRKTVANLEEVRNLGVKSEAEVIGKDDFAFYPKDLAEGFKVDDQLVLNTGTPVINKEEFVLDNSGKKRWKLTSKLPLKDTNNKIIGLVGVGRDITERKRAEEEIIMLAHSLKAVNECVSITDLENKIIFVNESFLKTYGYSENELVGKHIDIVRSLKNLPELVKEILTATKRGEWQGELLNKRKNGSEFPIYLSTTIINDKNNKPIGFIGVATDITERKKILEELITAKERAEQSDKLKSEFLAQISHEIRTPLNAIVGNVEYIYESFGEKMDSDTRNCFDDVDLASKRIIRTIELIINVAQLQTSSYKPQFAKVDLNSEIFNKLCQEHQLSAKRKGLEIIYTCKEKDTKVISDEYCITQIFANLIDNAIKYTKKGKVEILLEKNKAGNIIVEVKDTGIGISKEFLPRIFEPFTQEEQGLSRNFEGNGLGLSLVKRYCELNNLTIEVESEKNVGSTFTVIFNK